MSVKSGIKVMSKFLNDLKQYITENGENIYTIGEFCLGGEAEMEEIQPCNACNNIYSVSKVFTVTAVGMLVDRKLLCTGETVYDILRDEMPDNFSYNWRKTTVDMLLRHRVGIPYGALDIDSLDASRFNRDYLHEVAVLPWDCAPDSKMKYTDAAFYILSRIVAKKAGKPLQVFLWENLFLPLGYKEVAWSCCPQGHAMGATGLYIRADDMVKLGALYLQNGIWQGRRIISEDWVKTVLERNYEFGYIHNRNAYLKGGMRGQCLMVIPSQKKVVGWIGHRRESKLDLEKFVCEYKGDLE